MIAVKDVLVKKVKIETPLLCCKKNKSIRPAAFFDVNLELLMFVKWCYCFS